MSVHSSLCKHNPIKNGSLRATPFKSGGLDDVYVQADVGDELVRGIELACL